MLKLTMPRVVEINEVEPLAAYRAAWSELLRQTPGGSFFQSLEWLEVYWRHFGHGKILRAMVVLDGDQPTGIVPLVVVREKTKAGCIRALTFPLDDWGAFYGPIGPNSALALGAALEHVRRGPRNWDVFEPRWLGAPGADTESIRRAMIGAGMHAYATLWNRTAIVDCDGTWDVYWAARPGAWRRRYRHAEKMLLERGELAYVRHRPRSLAEGDGDPRWDLYDACEEIARRSWQAASRDGTTLSHDAVRPFFREMHAAAARAGAVDLNLLLLGGKPVAFIYGYHYAGYVYGLRRGFDAALARRGAGTVLLARTLQDSFARRDRVYDMGVGSLESKRHFLTRVIPVLRYTHVESRAPRALLLRLWRWRQSRRFARKGESEIIVLG